MLATAIIVFREILEAALIIGIVAAATQGVLRRGLWISCGVVAGVTGAFVVAELADVIVELADGMGQELFNACVLMAAVVMLAWHNIWMASHSRELVAQMKRAGAAVREGGEPIFALMLVVAVAVLREGSEIVLFLHGQYAQGIAATEMTSGGVAGLFAGAVVGSALYFGLLRIPTRYLFTVTGWMILLLAAGMASQAGKFLVQADILPAWGKMWDISMWLSDQSIPGRLLHTLVGYDASPLGMQLFIYLSTLTIIGVAMKVVNTKDLSSNAGTLKLLAITTVLPLALGFGPDAKAGAASHVHTMHGVYGETEIEMYGGTYEDNRNSVDGESGGVFSVGHGMTQNWFSEVELEWAKDANDDSLKYQGFEWVNIFKLTEPGQYFVDVGVFTELAFPDEHKEANTVEFGPMFQKELGSTVNNLNLIWVRDYGRQADHDTMFEYEWQTRVKGEPILEYGFQALGELGDWDNMPGVHDQEHKIGPAIFGVMAANGHNKFKYDGALLFGVTDDTPDYTLRFALEYEMY